MSTAIEWTDETWNPVTGCTKVSQGCNHCYAERLWPKVEAAERKRVHLEWGKVAPRPFTDVRCHPDRLDRPLRMRKPKRIFVNSMSDLFHEAVPDEFIETVFAVMASCPQHTFQVLTKRPQRMLNWFMARALINTGDELYAAAKRWPLPNVWLGVSVEDQATADERIPSLLETPAAVRFISAEPLLGPVALRRIRYDAAESLSWYDSLGGYVMTDGMNEPHGGGLRINQVITGGESGPKARPSHPDWFRSLRDQCAAVDVPFFFKQWGEWAHMTQVPMEVWKDCANYERIGDVVVWRSGKKGNGRLLDGREHSEYPR